MSLTKFQSYLFSKFPDGSLSGDSEWNVCCPRCGDDKNKAYVNIETGKGRCWHCEWKSSGWLSLVSYLERLGNLALAEKWIEEHNEFLSFTFNQVQPNSAFRSMMMRRLPGEFIPIGNPEGWGYEYFKSRGLYLDTMRYHNMGYCPSGYYEGRVIMPVVNGGKLEFFCDRAVDPTVEAKTLGVGNRKEKWPVDKSTVIFGLDLVQGCETVQVAEGIFTALSLENCVALLGKSCSDVQLMRLLKETQATKFILNLDPNTEEETAKLAARLMQWDRKVEIRKYENGMDANDYAVKGVLFPDPKPWSMEEQFAALGKGWIKPW